MASSPNEHIYYIAIIYIVRNPIQNVRGRVSGQLVMRKQNSKEKTVMNNEYTAVVKQDGEWWIGWIEEVPGVNCQEKTYEELKETLAVTLREALEFNRRDALNAAGSGFRTEKIAV